MIGAAGLVMDDGVTSRIAEDRYHMTTTTGGAAHVIAGQYDSVLRRGKELVNQHWLIELDHRAEIVVVGVDQDAAGHAALALPVHPLLPP